MIYNVFLVYNIYLRLFECCVLIFFLEDNLLGAKILFDSIFAFITQTFFLLVFLIFCIIFVIY